MGDFDMNNHIEMGHLSKSSSDAENPKFVPASDLHDRPVPPMTWHVQDFIPSNTVTLLSGNGGDGKSLLALQLAVSTALGRSWLGNEVKRGRALYVGAEDDQDEVHRRLDAIVKSEGVQFSDLSRLTLCNLAGLEAQLAVLDHNRAIMQPTPLFIMLEAYLSKKPHNFIVLDTLADFYGGDENVRAQARQFIGLLTGLALRLRTTILLLAHPSISGMANKTGTSGSTAWSNSVRSRLYLQRVERDGEQPDPNARILKIMKANYGETGQRIKMWWQDGAFVQDIRDGGALDRMAAEAKADRVFLKLVNQFAEQGRDVGSAPAANYAPNLFAKDPCSERISKLAFEKAMGRLFAAKRIRVEEHGPPSRRKKRLVEVVGTFGE